MSINDDIAKNNKLRFRMIGNIKLGMVFIVLFFIVWVISLDQSTPRALATIGGGGVIIAVTFSLASLLIYFRLYYSYKRLKGAKTIDDYIDETAAYLAENPPENGS